MTSGGSVGPVETAKLDSSSSSRNSFSLLKIPTPSLFILFSSPASIQREESSLENNILLVVVVFFFRRTPAAAATTAVVLAGASPPNGPHQHGKRFARFAARNSATNSFCGPTNSRNTGSDRCQSSRRNRLRLRSQSSASIAITTRTTAALDRRRNSRQNKRCHSTWPLRPAAAGGRRNTVVLRTLPAAIPVRLPAANAPHLLSQTTSSFFPWEVGTDYSGPAAATTIPRREWMTRVVRTTEKKRKKKTRQSTKSSRNTVQHYSPPLQQFIIRPSSRIRLSSSRCGGQQFRRRRSEHQRQFGKTAKDDYGIERIFFVCRRRFPVGRRRCWIEGRTNKNNNPPSNNVEIPVNLYISNAAAEAAESSRWWAKRRRRSGLFLLHLVVDLLPSVQQQRFPQS